MLWAKLRRNKWILDNDYQKENIKNIFNKYYYTKKTQNIVNLLIMLWSDTYIFYFNHELFYCYIINTKCNLFYQNYSIIIIICMYIVTL
jgi:hypothetical protein